MDIPVVTYPGLPGARRVGAVAERHGVVDLVGSQAGGEREGVGRRHQTDGPSMSVGDLVGVDRGLTLDVEDRADGDLRPFAEVVADPALGHRAAPLDPSDPVGACARIQMGTEHDLR